MSRALKGSLNRRKLLRGKKSKSSGLQIQDSVLIDSVTAFLLVPFSVNLFAFFAPFCGHSNLRCLGFFLRSLCYLLFIFPDFP
jgi:hypothetical protein